MNKSKESKSCPICVEQYTTKVRKRIKCPYCDQECCMECFTRYLKDPDSNSEAATCMGCNTALSLDFIVAETTKKFESEFRQVRTAKELSKEMSLLPASQHLVANELEKQKVRTSINEAIETERQLKIQLYNLRTAKTNLYRELNVLQNKKDEPAVRSVFVKHCVVRDCRGFLSSAWKCGTCETYACSDCHQVKASRDDPDHECQQDDLDTVAALADGTKPCPTCGTLISYVSGCSQMWCPGCNGTFNWTTGKAVTGVIHNPHYFEYLRMKGSVIPRQPGDNPCRGGCLPDLAVIEVILHQRNMNFPNLMECYRSIRHIEWDTMPRYPATVNQADNSDLRLDFLMKRISDEQMRHLLQVRLKKREKNHEVNQVLAMYVATMTDLFATYVNGTLDVKNRSVYAQAHAIRAYVNQELSKIGTRYKNVVPIIGATWRQV